MTISTYVLANCFLSMSKHSIDATVPGKIKINGIEYKVSTVQFKEALEMAKKDGARWVK